MRSINEPDTPTIPDPATDVAPEPAPVASIAEDGSTVYAGEIVPPTGELEGVAANPEPVDPAEPGNPQVKPVDKSGLDDFISTGKPN